MQIVAHIVFDEGKSLVPEQMGDILDPSGEKVVHADHGMSGLQQHIGEMTPKKPGSACNKETHTMMLLLHSSDRECHEIYQDRSERLGRVTDSGSVAPEPVEGLEYLPQQRSTIPALMAPQHQAQSLAARSEPMRDSDAGRPNHNS